MEDSESPPPPPEEKRPKGVSFAHVEEKSEESTQVEVRKEVEPYRYEPEERGETWDIYKQKSVMENVSKRKSEDAVLIKAKADAALRAAAVAEAASAATSAFSQEASEGRKLRQRTAVVAPGGNLCPTDEDLQNIGNPAEDDEDEEDEDEDDGAVDNPKEAASGGDSVTAGAQAEPDLSKLSPEELQELQAAQFGVPSEGAHASAEGYSADAVPAAPAPAEPAPAAAPTPAPAPAPEPAPAPVAAPAADAVGGQETFPLEVLQNGCPESVPPGRKEDFLNDADFEAALKMTRAEFEKLPQWKRTNAKKAAKIF